MSHLPCSREIVGSRFSFSDRAFTSRLQRWLKIHFLLHILLFIPIVLNFHIFILLVNFCLSVENQSLILVGNLRGENYDYKGDSPNSLFREINFKLSIIEGFNKNTHWSRRENMAQLQRWHKKVAQVVVFENLATFV